MPRLSQSNSLVEFWMTELKRTLTPQTSIRAFRARVQSFFFQIALSLFRISSVPSLYFQFTTQTMGLPWRHSVLWAFVAAWCIGAHAGYQSEVDQSKIRKIPVSYQRRNRKKLLLTGTFSKQLRSHSLSVVSSFRRT